MGHVAIKTIEHKMKKNFRISVRVEESERKKIEAIIRKEYPKLKNISDVIRIALTSFLGEKEN